VATNLFVAAALFRQPFGTVAKAILPTLAIICGALLILIYVPTISLGPLALREGRPVYAAFPWDGKEVAAEVVEPGEAAPTEPGKPLTMEEMMRRAKEGAAAQEAGGAPPTEPGKPLTMEEMMRRAKEGVAAEDAAAQEPAPAEPAPVEPAPQ
jgi:hypothetical protein